MSTFEIKMPKLGESITEGTIMSWSVKIGDTIQENDTLFEVNTEKVGAEIPSPVTGKVLEIFFKEGDTVTIGTVVAIIDIDGEESGNAKPEEKPAEVKNNPLTETPKEVLSSKTTNEAKVSDEDAGKWYSPVVLQKAQEAGISNEELDNIDGTGFSGRVSKKDIELYIDQKKKGISGVAQPKEQMVSSMPLETAKTVEPISQIPVFDEDEIIEMDVVRRTIADRMALSKKISAHVTTVVEVDVTKLAYWREKHKEEFQHREGINLTFMPAITEAVCKALIDFPRVNSSVDGYKIIQRKHINVGVAVSLDDGNLVVPVIKDANKLNFSGIASAIDALAKKARQNKLKLDDVQGGTFSITNYGSFKNIIATPIINQPEVAILGVGYVQKKPSVVETPEGDVIAIRHKMYLSLSFDHRVLNGALGGIFVKRVADYLENWERD